MKLDDDCARQCDVPANVQYVWPNVSRRFLYAATSSRGSDTAPTRSVHYVSAFRIDSASGALARHGDPIPLPAKPRRRMTPHSS